MPRRGNQRASLWPVAAVYDRRLRGTTLIERRYSKQPRADYRPRRRYGAAMARQAGAHRCCVLAARYRSTILTK